MTQNQKNEFSASGPPTLDVEADIARIVLNRPLQHNRFEPIDIETMSMMLREVSANKSIRVLVVTGRGESFSAGYDLMTLSGDQAQERTASFAGLCDSLELFRLPTVCGLNGSVYGGATDLALACDIRVGSRGCHLQMSPGRIGIEYYYSGLRRYVEQLGLSEAKRLFLTGEKIDAETMLRIGFLHELAAPEVFESQLTSVASALAQRSPSALRGLKASLNSVRRGTADPAAVDDRFFASLISADAREGLKAWSERRPPRFTDV